MRHFFPKKSKRGVTLVESVIAVVVLGIFATGILTLLTSGGTKILETSQESAAYAQATQKLDFVIAAISNGSDEYVEYDAGADGASPKVKGLKQDALSAKEITLISTYGTKEDGTVGTAEGADLYDQITTIRGWYLSLTYEGQTVTGFAANAEGVFDHD